MQAKRGFTLIELLVVIAIVAVLAAIIFPVFVAARKAANEAAALSEMRQIAIWVRERVEEVESSDATGVAVYRYIFPFYSGPLYSGDEGNLYKEVAAKFKFRYQVDILSSEYHDETRETGVDNEGKTICGRRYERRWAGVLIHDLSGGVEEAETAEGSLFYSERWDVDLPSIFGRTKRDWSRSVDLWRLPEAVWPSYRHGDELMW